MGRNYLVLRRIADLTVALLMGRQTEKFDLRGEESGVYLSEDSEERSEVLGQGDIDLNESL